jgi:hypothetical protein
MRAAFKNLSSPLDTAPPTPPQQHNRIHFDHLPQKYQSHKMDSSSALNQGLDLSKLSDKDKQELQQFIVNESQKARIQQCTCPRSSISPPPLIYSTLLLPITYHLCTSRLFSSAVCISATPASSRLSTVHILIKSCSACSRALPDRRVLEEMCDGHDPQRKAGPERGELCAELRRPVPGCEFHRH